MAAGEETELYKVKGELRLMPNPPDEAEAERHFHTAIDIARRRKARFFELRASMRKEKCAVQAAMPKIPRASNSATNALRP